MATKQSTTFCTERSDFEARQENGEMVAYTAALHLPQQVKPMCEELWQLSRNAENVNIFNPISSYFKLREIRRNYSERHLAFQSQLHDCVTRMSKPVEGATTMELSWIQGFTFAAGMSAFTELNVSLSAVSEALDRKSAYSMACFSLYVAFVSLAATLILGVMSLS